MQGYLNNPPGILGFSDPFGGNICSLCLIVHWLSRLQHLPTFLEMGEAVG